MRSAGFGLIELMIAVALAGLLASYAIPAMRAAWMRSQSVTGTHSISLTVASDCSWSASQDGNAVSSRSFTASQISSTAKGLSCSLGSGSFPLTFSFDSQGFLVGASTVALTFTAASGQTFPLQILSSGAVIRSNGAS
jgi:prepilin-type N-terminal cleavage/methylation domain-containing protein